MKFAVSVNVFLLVVLISVFTIISAKYIENTSQIKSDEIFSVSIIHLNDFHARFEETNEASSPCLPGQRCVGGFARVVTVIRNLLEKHKNTHPIYLNAGDNFQGTFWYNVGRWNVTAQFLNLLPADAITLGNHEFSHQIDGLTPFLEHLNSPVVVSNIDDTDEPSIHGKYQKSIIIDRYDRRIGVIGVIWSMTDRIARTGHLKFLDEVQSIKLQAAALKTEGVNIIIVLSHCGLDVDTEIARNVGSDIDVIVGGHSHTFMYSGDNPPGPETPQTQYPVVVTQEDGHVVLIVQAYAFAKYVGDLTVDFDQAGNVVGWTGNPIYLDAHIEKDPTVEQYLQSWRPLVEYETKRIIGNSRVHMDRSLCLRGECNLGNLVTDAFVHQYLLDYGQIENGWTNAAIAVTNVGGVRTTLYTGNITIGDLITTMPFENTLDYVEMRGIYVVEMLEHSVSQSFSDVEFIGPFMLQFSGMNVLFNTSNPIGYRVISVEMMCNRCNVPIFEPLNPFEIYPLIVPSFMVYGGDGFDMFLNHMQNHRIGPIDIDALVEYVERRSPITTGINGRIVLVS